MKNNSNDGAPSRFTYFENIDSREAKILKNIFRITFNVKNPCTNTELLNAHKAALMKSDQLADDLVREVFDALPPGEGKKLFDKASEEGIASIDNPPPALQAFFAAAESVPHWLDWDELNRGIDVCHRLGKLATFSLSVAALQGGYTNPDLAKPLIFTGGLAGDATFNRVNYTSAFWMEVMEKDSLRKHASGYKVALFVRLKHALVRRHIMKNPEWQTQDWGVAINLSDSAITNIGFSTVMLLGSKTLGMRVSDEEIEAVLHLWRYLGYLLGDDDNLLPKSKEQAIQGLYFAAVGNKQQANDETRLLASSFLESCKQVGCGRYYELQGFFKYWFYRILAQYLIPPFNHKKLGLPSSYGLFLLVPLVSFPLLFISESVRRYIPGMKPLFIRYGRWRQRHWMKERFAIANMKPTTRGPIQKYVKE